MNDLKPKPKATNSLAERELDKAEAQFEAFDQQVKDLTMDRLNEAPKQELEPQTKMSVADQQKSKDIYLKPDKTISSREKFNDRFRSEWNYAKEYVQFIAENNEIIGEAIEIWSKPFPGVNAEFWKVPTNKPVWGPRYLAEQIKSKFYHRLKSEQSTITGADGMGTYTGGIIVDTTIQRLDARPVSTRKSVFMGAGGF
jgi:hypothetical protein